MLRITGLAAGYGGSTVLQGIDLDVAEGSVVAVLGRNGMGKTTLLRAVMGLVRPIAGRIEFRGRDLAGHTPYAIAQSGIAYVPQGRDIFAGFTVEENLRLGMAGKPHLGKRIPSSLYDYFPVLRERRAQRAGTLSGGEQQQLAIARALAGAPDLLLLDEPSEGIQPSIIAQLATTLRAVSGREGLTILIVEQNVELVTDLADDCVFVEDGQVAARVDVAALQSDESLLTRYLSV